MLILSREPGEAIVLTCDGVPGEIVIKYFAGRGNRIQLGIQADDSVTIMRGELVAQEAAA